MNHIPHIIRKDLRRLRWPLVAWCLTVFGRVLVDTVGSDVAFEGFGPQFAITELSAVIRSIEVLLSALLISGLVHDEPLVSLDAFWLTRPIERGSLLAAKLALSAFFLIALPLAGEIVVMARFRTRLPDMLEASGAIVLHRLLWSSLLMAVAVLTPTLMRYVLTLVGIVATYAGSIAFILIVSLLVMRNEQWGGGGVADPASGFITTLIIIAAALTVIVYQYRRRRVRRALLLAAAGVIAVLVVRGSWPLAKPVAAEPSEADASAIAVVLDSTVPPRIQDVFGARRAAALKKDITARVLVTGLPQGMDVRHISARSTLTLPRLTLTSDGERGSAFRTTIGDFSGRRSIEAVLNAQLLFRPETADEHWVALMRLDESDVAREAREAGRLTSTLNVYLNRSVLAGTMPIADGSVVETGSYRFQIVRVINRAPGYTVLLRTSHVESLHTVPVYRQFAYFLRNAARHEAVAGDSMPVLGREMQIGFSPLVLETSAGRGGFVLDEYELQFPRRIPSGMPGPSVDTAWLAGTEFVVVETLSAGSVTRVTVVDGFRMVPQ